MTKQSHNVQEMPQISTHVKNKTNISGLQLEKAKAQIKSTK